MTIHTCIFCQIIKGQLPSTQLHSDEHCLAILDIHPMSRGHILVIPREHHQHLNDAPKALRDHIFAITSQLSSQIVCSQLGAQACNILINNGRAANQEIPHLHIHIIPRYRGDSLAMLAKIMTKPLLMLKITPPQQLAHIAQQIGALQASSHKQTL